MNINSNSIKYWKIKLERKIAKKDSIERKKMKNIIFEKLKEKRPHLAG
jgi:hypothetical protein